MSGSGFPRSPVRSLLRALCRANPLVSGYGAIGKLAPMIWAAQSLEVPTRTRLRGGSIALVDPSDALGRTVYYCGDWDPKVNWVCRRLLRPGDTFLDIGAHCGVVALGAAHAVGKSGQVHAFEPNPVLAGLLSAAAALNGYTQLRTHEVALSNEDGKADLHLAFGHSFFGSLSRRLDAPGRRIPIALKHASRYLESLDLPKIRLIKIDVEGHEETVLAALDRVFSRTPPDAVVIETDDFEVPYWKRGPVQALRAAGYHMLGIPKSLFRVRPQLMTPDEPPRREFHDSIGVSPGAFAEVCERLGVRN
jgi:FkbM family methyltransferase